MVVDQGFEPCRSSPSDQSPVLIRHRRIPMLSTMATVEGIEPPLAVLETAVLPLYYTVIPGADSQIRTDDLNVGNVSHYPCAIPALPFLCC